MIRDFLLHFCRLGSKQPEGARSVRRARRGKKIIAGGCVVQDVLFREDLETALRTVDLWVCRSMEPEAQTEIICSKCRWNCAVPSRCRTVLDLLLAPFLLRPFRCRSCCKRFYRLSIR